METITIKERGCYVVIKWIVDGREWTSTSKFTSKDNAEKFIEEEKGFFSDVTYEIVDI